MSYLRYRGRGSTGCWPTLLNLLAGVGITRTGAGDAGAAAAAPKSTEKALIWAILEGKTRRRTPSPRNYALRLRHLGG